VAVSFGLLKSDIIRVYRCGLKLGQQMETTCHIQKVKRFQSSSEFNYITRFKNDILVKCGNKTVNTMVISDTLYVPSEDVLCYYDKGSCDDIMFLETRNRDYGGGSGNTSIVTCFVLFIYIILSPLGFWVGYIDFVDNAFRGKLMGLHHTLVDSNREASDVVECVDEPGIETTNVHETNAYTAVGGAMRRSDGQYQYSNKTLI